MQQLREDGYWVRLYRHSKRYPSDKCPTCGSAMATPNPKDICDLINETWLYVVGIPLLALAGLWAAFWLGYAIAAAWVTGRLFDFIKVLTSRWEYSVFIVFLIGYGVARSLVRRKRSVLVAWIAGLKNKYCERIEVVKAWTEDRKRE